MVSWWYRNEEGGLLMCDGKNRIPCCFLCFVTGDEGKGNLVLEWQKSCMFLSSLGNHWGNFFLTAVMGYSSDLFIGEAYSGDFSSTPVSSVETDPEGQSVLCWALLWTTWDAAFWMSYKPLPTFQRRQQQAQSLGSFVKQLSCHSDCLLNQCGRLALSVLVVVNGTFLPNTLSLWGIAF